MIVMTIHFIPLAPYTGKLKFVQLLVSMTLHDVDNFNKVDLPFEWSIIEFEHKR